MNNSEGQLGKVPAAKINHPTFGVDYERAAAYTAYLDGGPYRTPASLEEAHDMFTHEVREDDKEKFMDDWDALSREAIDSAKTLEEFHRLYRTNVVSPRCVKLIASGDFAQRWSDTFIEVLGNTDDVESLEKLDSYLPPSSWGTYCKENLEAKLQKSRDATT